MDLARALTAAGAVDSAHTHDAELRQIDPADPGSPAARLPRNRLLRAVKSAGLAGRIRRRPQTATDRQLASLRTTNDSHHLAGVLPYALASEPVFAAAGFIEGKRAGRTRLIADTTNEFDGRW
jgi:hypothetical protein